MQNTSENSRSGLSATATMRTSKRYRVVRRALPATVSAGVPAVVHEPRPAATRRDYKKIIGGVFLAALLLLIFFSKTIYGYNLPVVTAVKPEKGRLSKLEMSSGIAEWAEVENLYAAVGGIVEEVLVKEGDAVTQGQPLYRLSFDRDEAERKLREIQNSRSRVLADIQNINIKLEKQTRYMDSLAGESYELEEVSTYDLEAVRIDILKARAEYREIRDGGAEAGDLELERARYNLEALYLKQEELARKLEEQEKNALEALEEQEKKQEMGLMDYEADIASLKLDLQAKNIELNNLSIQEEPYKKALEDFETHAVVTSPANGSVITMSAVKGETIREEQQLASVGITGTFEVKCNVSLDNNFVIPGDIVELSNSSHVVKGTVTKITPTAQNKIITLALDSGEVAAGETFDITFKKESETTYTLVPNGALNQDNDGYFLNQIKRRDGILGKEYYLERLDVYIGDSDSSNTVIAHGITFFEPVALISDKPVSTGDVITLANAGDFFEK